MVYDIDKIKRLIYAFGYVAATVVLTEQEREENYELCHVILSAINIIFITDNVPTRYGEEVIEWVNNAFPLRERNWFMPMLNESVNSIYTELKLKRNYETKLV